MKSSIFIILLVIIFTSAFCQTVDETQCGGCAKDLATGTIQPACARQIPSVCVRMVKCSSTDRSQGGRRYWQWPSNLQEDQMCPQYYQCAGKTEYKCCSEASKMTPDTPCRKSRFKPGSLRGSYRFRVFRNGLPTPKPATNENGTLLCKVPTWTKWSEWTKCTTTCGGTTCGMQERSRTCTDRDIKKCRCGAQEKETRQCGSDIPCQGSRFQRYRTNSCCWGHSQVNGKCQKSNNNGYPYGLFGNNV